VPHVRTRDGDHEVGLSVERPARRVGAIEVTLATAAVRPAAAARLHWLARRAQDTVIDKVILTTGERAYRRPHGVAVVPAALLGALIRPVAWRDITADGGDRSLPRSAASPRRLWSEHCCGGSPRALLGPWAARW